MHINNLINLGALTLKLFCRKMSPTKPTRMATRSSTKVGTILPSPIKSIYPKLDDDVGLNITEDSYDEPG